MVKEKGQEAQDNFITAGIPVTIVVAAVPWTPKVWQSAISSAVVIEGP